MTTLAAVAFVIVTFGAVGFQVGLALGVPWGSYAMGGTFAGRFPPRMRVAAMLLAALLAFFGLVVGLGPP